MICIGLLSGYARTATYRCRPLNPKPLTLNRGSWAPGEGASIFGGFAERLNLYMVRLAHRARAVAVAAATP